MLAPHTNILLENGQCQTVSLLNRGSRVLVPRQRRARGQCLARVSGAIHGFSVSLVTSAGHRLVVGSDQKVLVRGKRGSVWRAARAVNPGDHLITVEAVGFNHVLFGVAAVTCTVHAHKPGEPWHVLQVPGRAVVAEGVVCRTT